MPKVLVIEPDAKVRLSLVSLFNASDAIDLVGFAPNPMMARMQIKLRQPNVLVLATDHQSEAASYFLLKLMQTTPLPVVILSAQALPKTDGERQMTRSGIGTILLKPREISALNQDFSTELVRRVQQVQQTAAKSIARNKAKAQPEIKSASPPPPVSSAVGNRHCVYRDTLLAIGASTGGTEALRRVLPKFPADFPAVVIVQHIPKAFAAKFVERLDQCTPMRVVVAKEGEQILKGHIYVGAEDEHFRIEKQGASFVCRVDGRDKINGHCPSVNALFDSLAEHAGANVIGALMTGMGDDGATGLKKMRDAGGRTLVQDEESSVVWGMPGEAMKIGAAEDQVALNVLGDTCVKWIGERA
ncbi:MAG: chemotaxis protein CheB [Mariprofundaceae bacterium]